MLGGAISPDIGRAEQRRFLFCVEDHAAAVRFHMLDSVFHAQPDAFRIDRYDALEVLFLNVGDDDPGVLARIGRGGGTRDAGWPR